MRVRNRVGGMKIREMKGSESEGEEDSKRDADSTRECSMTGRHHSLLHLTCYMLQVTYYDCLYRH